MPWYTLRNVAEIKQILDSIIQTNTEIEVHIPGDEVSYFSKCLEILPVGEENQGESVGPEIGIVLGNITPRTGNDRLRNARMVELFFSYRRYLCSFHARVILESESSLRHLHLIALPRAIKIDEKRKEDRIYPESPEFLSAVFAREGRNHELRIYELSVLNYSKHGLGLLVNEGDLPMLKELEPGERISDMILYADELLLRLSAVVRHKSEVTEGPYAGALMIGVESETELKSVFNELSSQTSQT